jgi:hypothetical protein
MPLDVLALIGVQGTCAKGKEGLVETPAKPPSPDRLRPAILLWLFLFIFATGAILAVLDSLL